MANWISFRGVKTTDIGLYIAQMPSHKKAEQRMTEYEIAGRDGAVHVVDGYRPFDLVFVLTMLGGAASLRQTINAWADGEGKLITSDQPLLCYEAIAEESIVYERRAYNGVFYDTATVTFRCQPIMREATESFYTYNSAGGTLINPGTVKALPTIVLSGSGDCTLTIGSQTITLEDVSADVTIDCSAGYVYTASGASAMTGEFFEIPLGTSSVSIGGGTTKVVITPNWGWL